MTTTCNPIYYLKHAWEGTNSAWGKASIVLFYSFVWFMILSSLQVLLVPSSDMGYECMLAGQGDFATALVACVLRQTNLFAMGFFLYADRGGIKVWNVAMVFLVYLIWSIIAGHFKSIAASISGAQKACNADLHSFYVMLGVTNAWTGLALICAYIDDKSGGGNAAETTPLNV